MTTYKTSEWVSPGHPDKVADYISEYILDRLIEKDLKTRYALEVQIKDNHVSLAGEVTTKAEFKQTDMAIWAREAVNEIGYTKEYQKRFAEGSTICGDELAVSINLSRQSQDIAQGVNKDAWGDQGIFFGYFCRETPNGEGIDQYLARKLGEELYHAALFNTDTVGIDIKTQVTVVIESTGEYEVKEVIVAIPCNPEKITEKQLKAFVKKKIETHIPEAKGAKLIVNGTGAYQVHGPVGDSGTTGRKLVVDFYGSRSRIGGGSPWTKDGSKADLTLNIFAYEMARNVYNELKDQVSGIHHVETELSCCIGKQNVRMFVTAYDENNVPVYEAVEEEKIKPSVLIKKYGLDTPHYADLCRYGLFSCIGGGKK